MLYLAYSEPALASSLVALAWLVSAMSEEMTLSNSLPGCLISSPRISLWERLTREDWMRGGGHFAVVKIGHHHGKEP